ncbi:MAG: sigma-70 family RNA polymerase sigma factor [Clostridiales bacterium]|nr:sigma-70 family RNA polymerase sigma factor [Clostridiales bacterium]
MNEQSGRPVDCRISETEETVKRNENRLLRAALAIMGSKADAEDVVQDVFLKLFEKQPRFETPEHETAWLLTVTANLCKTRLSSPWRKKTVPLLADYPAQTGAQQNILEAVLSLPAKYRAIIHLFYYEGYSTKEIAEITQQKESTVRQQLTRARRALKAFLGEENHERL